MSWRCSNCESSNEDSVQICDVCGAVYPSVDVRWENQNGKPGQIAKISWTGVGYRAAFAVCGKTTYYLTKQNSAEVEIDDKTKEFDIYFCGTGGYIKHTYVVGSCVPQITSFTASGLSLRGSGPSYTAKWGSEVRVSWKSKDISRLVLSGLGDTLPAVEANGDRTFTMHKDMHLKLLYSGTTKSEIHITCEKPTRPRLVDYDIVRTTTHSDGQIHVGDTVRVTGRVSYDTGRVYVNGIYTPSSRFDIECKIESTFTPITVKAYPTGVTELDVSWYKEELKDCVLEFTDHIHAIYPVPTIEKFEHTATTFKKGEPFVVKWKTEGFKYATLYLESEKDYFRDEKHEVIKYPADDHQITISGLSGKTSIKIVFWAIDGDTVEKVIPIRATHFVKLFNMFDKEKES